MRLGNVIAAAAVLWCASVLADPAPTLRFDIPAQPVASALELYARQAKVEFLIPYESLAGIVSASVKGEFEKKKALELLLQDTGLEARFSTDGGVKIVRRGVNTAGNPADQMRMAALGAEETARTKDKASTEDTKNSMIVEGERDKRVPFEGANLDLTRTEDDALPFVTFSARDLELSGAANLEEFFRSRLTQNFTSVHPGEIQGNLETNRSGANQVSMRGWSGQETVFLLNGRRIPSKRAGFENDTVFTVGNFRGIPLGSVERIEILPAAGSAIYGQNATGGVINIITRKDYQGGQLMVNYENPVDASASKPAVDFSYALPVGKTTLRAAAGYSESNPLELGDRAESTAARWRQLIMQRDPGRIIDSDMPTGATPNIHVADAFFAEFFNFYLPGSDPLFGVGTSSFGSVPNGHTGGGGLAAFQSRAGQYNLTLADGANDLSGSNAAPIGSALRNSAVSVGIDRNFGTHWSGSFDYSRTEERMRGAGGYISYFFTNLLVQAAVPTNPFGVPVGVRFDDPRMDRPEQRKALGFSNDAFVLTLRGDYGSWRGFLDLNYTRVRDNYTYEVFDAPIGGWDAALMSGAYNPFVDMRAVAPAANNFYDEYAKRSSVVDGATRNYLVTGKVSGPVWQLPAGALLLTAGAEWSRENRYKVDVTNRTVNSRTNALIAPGDPANVPGRYFDINNYSIYAEANVPLISAAQQMRWAHGLELFASSRLSRQVRNAIVAHGYVPGFGAIYEPVEYKTDPYVHAFGLRYEALEGVILRVSRSLGFKPPGLFYVEENNQYPSPLTVFDRQRGNLQVTLQPNQYIQSAGNPDLKPETTQSTSVGLLLRPQWVSGLHMSIDYLENVRDDAISSLSAQDVLDLEAALPGRVQRNASGQIVFVNASFINLNQIASRSVDFTIEQSFENVRGGRLVFNAAATRNLSFKVQASARVAPVENVRNPVANLSQQIRWNGNAQLRWESQQWTMGWGLRYFDSVLTRPSDLVAQGSDHAGSAFEHDVTLGYRVPESNAARGLGALLEDVSVTFGVKNVFDREPRFWAAATGMGYVGFDSLYGRSMWLQIRKNIQ